MHWRDCSEWKYLNISLSTSSNETAKLYDAALTQLCHFYSDDTLGGLKGTMKSLFESDPDFLMGYVMANGLQMLNTTQTNSDEDFEKSFSHMLHLGKKSEVLDYEKQHVEALLQYSQGYHENACRIWDDILIDYPTERLASEFIFGVKFYSGENYFIRDLYSRILPFWESTNDKTHCGYLKGRHSFSLIGTHQYSDAKATATEALSINPKDIMATHALSHFYEETCQSEKGIQFLNETENDWSQCNGLDGHVHWHKALFHLDLGQFEEVIEIYDSQLKNRAESQQGLDIHNAASLLFRMEMEGLNVTSEWKKLFKFTKPLVHEHTLCWHNVHLMPSCLGADEIGTAQDMLNSMEEFISNNDGCQSKIMKNVGLNVCKSFYEYKLGNYEKAVDNMLPVRYKIKMMGGSDAQRDFMNVFLIHSAMRSSHVSHKKLALQLLHERKALKKNSFATQRLFDKCENL